MHELAYEFLHAGYDLLLIVVSTVQYQASVAGFLEIGVDPHTESGKVGCHGRNMEHQALKRCVTPWFIIRGIECKVEPDQQIIVFHVEDTVITVKV